MCSRVQFIKNFFKGCDLDVDCGKDFCWCMHSQCSSIGLKSKDIMFVNPFGEQLENYFEQLNIDYSYLSCCLAEYQPAGCNSTDSGFIHCFSFSFHDQYNPKDCRSRINTKNKINFGFCSCGSNYGSYNLRFPDNEKLDLFVIHCENLKYHGWLNSLIITKYKNKCYRCNIEHAERGEGSRAYTAFKTESEAIKSKFSGYTLNDIITMWNEYLKILEIEKLKGVNLIKDTVMKYKKLMTLNCKLTKPIFENMSEEEILKLNLKYYDIINSIENLSI